MNERVDNYYQAYNVYEKYFKSQKWRIKKIPAFEEIFAKFYTNGSKEEKKIIEKLFYRLMDETKGVKDINKYIVNYICNSKHYTDITDLAHKLQLTFILLYVISKIFKISNKNNKTFFNLFNLYLENDAIIFWKNNRKNKTCTVAIMDLKHPAPFQQFLQEKNIFEDFFITTVITLTVKQINNTFAYMYSKKTKIHEFDSKYDTFENIEKNYKNIHNYFTMVKGKERFCCPWCNPFKKDGQKYKKCQKCNKINKKLKELNNLCPNSYKPFKDDYDISEQIIRYLRHKKDLWNSIEKTYNNIIKKYEKNLNKIKNPEDKIKIENLIKGEEITKSKWQQLYVIYHRLCSEI